MTLGTLLLYVVVLYVAAGLVTGLAFVVQGVTQVLPHPAPVSVGARILLFPGAVALWPLILRRWLKAPRTGP